MLVLQAIPNFLLSSAYFVSLLVGRIPVSFLFFFKLIYYYFFKLFIYLFMAALGLRCCTWAFSRCGERGLLFVVVHGLLIAVASRCGAWALGARASVVVARGLNSCGARA